MDGNVSCKVCTHYHHQGNHYLCDVGVFDVQVAGMATIAVTQIDCIRFSNVEAPVTEVAAILDKRTKAYKESLKC